MGYAVEEEEEEDSEEGEWWDEEMGEYVVRERVKVRPSGGQVPRCEGELSQGASLGGVGVRPSLTRSLTRSLAQPALTTNKPRENAHDLAQDRLYLLAFRLLSSLLPSPDSPTPKIYDFLPSSLLSPLIELSTLPDLLTLLLRNDSVPEWQRRSEVYFSMLDVLGKIGGSEGLLGVLFGERREKRWSEGIGGWMRAVGEVRWERKALPGQAEEAGKGKGKGKGKAAPRGQKRKAGEREEEEENKGEVVMTAPCVAGFLSPCLSP